MLTFSFDSRWKFRIANLQIAVQCNVVVQMLVSVWFLYTSVFDRTAVCS